MVKKLCPLKSFAAAHPEHSMPWLRKKILHKHDNGFDRVIYQPSRKILIDEEAFSEWLEENRNLGEVSRG